MAQIQPILKVELNPLNPVPELCAVISAVMPYHPGQEIAILEGVQDAIQVRLNQLKGDDQSGERLLQPDTNEKDQ